MIKRMSALMGTLAVMAATLVAGTGTANAIPAQPGANGSDYTTGTHCVERSGVTTCLLVEWSRQGDGSGVRLEGFHVTTNGCGNLEGTDPYREVRPSWWNANTNHLDYQYEFGAEPCNFYKDLSNPGADKAGMDFRFSARARVDFGTDHDVYMGFTLKPGGYYTFNYADAVAV